MYPPPAEAVDAPIRPDQVCLVGVCKKSAIVVIGVDIGVLVEELAKTDDILKGELEAVKPTSAGRGKESVEEVQEARPLSTGSWKGEGGSR
jgi:hypothetical protein